MATTTNYGWTTPDDTALVKDGAAAIRTLGSSVDTTTKALNPSTTLGDIEYRSSTANTNTRLGIGSTGQILTVAGGVPSWAAAPSSSPVTDTDTVAATDSTTSTSYTNLGGVGPSITMTTGTKALVILTALCEAEAGRSVFMDLDISGATTRSASDATALFTFSGDGGGSVRASVANLFTLTAGSNTFTAKYKSSSASATAYFKNRTMFVMNLA